MWFLTHGFLRTRGGRFCFYHLAAASLVFSACATIPEQAVTLSTVVGNQLTVLQASHEATLTGYFDLSRRRIEDFLEQRWMPTFLEIFVDDADLLDKLVSVEPLDQARVTRLTEELNRLGVAGADQGRAVAAAQSAFGDAERGQIVLEFAEAALQEIEEQRRSVVEPLNQLERTALSDLRATYVQLVEAQAAVTAHLSSLREAEVQQDALLERFGLRETRDRILDDAIGINEKIMGLIDRGGNAADTLKAISETISTSEPDDS